LRSESHSRQVKVGAPLRISLHLLPALVRVELGHRGGDVAGRLAEVFLIHHAVLVDDEGHDARIAVLRGLCDYGKSAGHLSVDDVSLGAALGVRALLVKHAEVRTKTDWIGSDAQMGIAAILRSDSRFCRD